MSEYPASLAYASTHEWAHKENDGTVTVGISDYAQEQLGDIVYVELPEIGQRTVLGDEIAVVESVKAASDIYAPISGEIVQINENLDEEPEIVNSDPYIEGWFFVINPDDASDLDNLLSAEDYEKVCEAEEE